MLTSFLKFSLLLGLKGAVALKACPPLDFPVNGKVTCIRENETVNCGLNLPFGSIAKFTCQEFYKLSSERRGFLKCLLNGSWSSVPPECIPVEPFGRQRLAEVKNGFIKRMVDSMKIEKRRRAGDCGKRSKSVSLIVNGMMASRGAFPWHVAIYNLINGNQEYWCGGSLISEMAVITAAHCTWQIPSEKLMLVFGKSHREFNFPEKFIQKIKAKKVEILSSYQDVAGNYNGDVAVIFLERPVILGHYSAPVCIDRGQQFMDKHLVEGIFGMVPGWGLTENDTFSDFLRVVRIPVVSDKKCIADQERDFKKFVTYTSFCAGFGNGTGVCNGDSGGGLTFFDEISGRWYLQGLVSVSPRRKGTSYCDPNYYTVFTKVSMFSKWIEAVEKTERGFSSVEKAVENSTSKEKRFQNLNDCIRKYVQKDYENGKKKLVYPHSEKMMELVRYSRCFGKIL